MRYIDTHCHLDLHHFDQDRDDVISRALDTGVDTIINPGIDVLSSRNILLLSKKHPQVLPSIGIHPNDIVDDYPSQFLEIRAMVQNEKIVAIGEIGLDDYHKDVPISIQTKVFQMQLDLAAEYDLPVIIHSRDTLGVISPILTGWAIERSNAGHHPPYGVMHSFEGDIHQAQEFIRAGFMISIAGPVTYKNAAIKHKLAEQLPLDSLLIETDSPYLTPVPYRGSRNEPAYLPQIGQRAAIIRVCDEADLAQATTRNASTLFHLGVTH